jgi:WD40-like Beta Propeller Repeat
MERSLTPEDARAAATRSGEEFAAGARGEAAQATGQVQPAHTTSSAEYLVEGVRRHKAVAALALALLVVIVGVGGFALYRVFKSGKPDATTPAPKFTALTAGGKIGDLIIDGELSISPDGKYVSYTLRDDKQQSSLWVMQIATKTQAQVVPPSSADYTATTFSPDGQFIYYGRREARLSEPVLYRVPVIGGSPTKVLENVTSAITFSPDGKRFAFVRDEARRGKTPNCLSPTRTAAASRR